MGEFVGNVGGVGPREGARDGDLEGDEEGAR